MLTFLRRRRLLRRLRHLQRREDIDLLKVFTNADDAQATFASMITTSQPTKRMLVVPGIGGVGKSTLLQRYAIICRQHGIAAATVRSEEMSSPVDFLAGWIDQLACTKVKLQTSRRLLARYRNIETEVLQRQNQPIEAATSKIVAKSAEAALGGLPIVGPVIGSVAEITFEGFVGWLRGFLPKRDVDLYLYPDEEITNALLDDLEKSRRRIVLMVDTYERVGASDKWLCNFARQVTLSSEADAVLVIAGRIKPTWDDIWSGWRAMTEFFPLNTMEPADIELLTLRYYAQIRGEAPERSKLEAISRFSRGLPLAARTSVHFAVEYEADVDDFQVIAPEVAKDLANRILDVSPDLRKGFEAAAVLRHLNIEVLRAVLNYDVDELFSKLERWPFVHFRPDLGELVIHEAVREVISEAVRSRSIDQFTGWHLRAANYYRGRMVGLSMRERRSAALERVYHLIHAGDESAAISESRSIIEEARLTYDRDFTETIIALLDDYLVQDTNSAWISYFRYLASRMRPQIDAQVAAARDLQISLHREPMGSELRIRGTLALADAPTEAEIPVDERIHWLEEGVGSDLLSPLELANANLGLVTLYRTRCDWQSSSASGARAVELYRRHGFPSGQVTALYELSYTHLLTGLWDEALEAAASSVEVARQAGGYLLLSPLKQLGWAHTYRGNLQRALEVTKEALAIATVSDDKTRVIQVSRRLAEIYDRQRRWSESVPLYRRLLSDDELHGRRSSRFATAALLGVSFANQGLLEEARETLIGCLPNLHIHVEPMARVVLGDVLVKLGQLDEAVGSYERVSNITGERPYYLAAATIGFLRAATASSNFADLPQFVRTVESISFSHNYFDHLARVSLAKGHLAWGGSVSEWGVGFDAAFRHYKTALTFAVRYNRFLLDDVLSGTTGAIIEPIIQRATKLGQGGMRMLEALEDWWRVGEVEAPSSERLGGSGSALTRLTTIERSAREAEPGDGIAQPTVVEQIEGHLV